MPAGPDDLPDEFGDECRDLSRIYAPPGGLLLAYRGEQPIGCVGIAPDRPTGAARIARLYVCPGHRGGVGRLLMQHAHRHAARAGFDRLVLGVLPSRASAIGLYRRLGYRPADAVDRPTGLLEMHRACPSPVAPA